MAYSNSNQTTNTTTNSSICETFTTTLNCNCTHPVDYIFQLASDRNSLAINTASFAEVIDRILDKGIVKTNCDICCPNCSDSAATFSSVETYLKYAEAVGLTYNPVPAANESINIDGQYCCRNVKASVETYLKYAEAVGLTQSAAVPAIPFAPNAQNNSDYFYFASSNGVNTLSCCEGFNECWDELLCWATQHNGDRAANAIDILLDKGIVEDGSFDNCDGKNNGYLCKILENVLKYSEEFPTFASKIYFIDRLLDKGLVVKCDSAGRITISSVETHLKYAEAVGGPGAFVPAIGTTTTTQG